MLKSVNNLSSATLTGPIIVNGYTISLPAAAGAAGTFLRSEGDGTTTWTLISYDSPTFTGLATFEDILVTGTATYTEVKDLKITSNYMTVNSGETGSGITLGEAGLEIDRGLAPNYLFQFRESDQTFRVGISGQTVALAARENTPTSGAIPAWNATSYLFDTAIGLSASIVTQLRNIGVLTINSTRWGYLAAFDQALTTGATPTFSTLVVSTGHLTLGTVFIDSDNVVGQNRSYRLPDVGTDTQFVMEAGAQTLTGAKSFSLAVAIAPTSNQIVLGTGQTVTINATAGAFSSYVHTIPDVGASTQFVMAAGAQTVAGAKTFSTVPTFSSLTASTAVYLNSSKQLTGVALTNGQLLIGSTGAAPAVGTLTGTANRVTVTDGAGSITLSGPQDLHSGAVPTFAGAMLSGAYVDLSTYRLQAENLSASRTYTIPDLGVNNTFAMLAGSQTFSGSKTFSGSVTVTGGQIVLGLATLAAVTQSTARVYTIPDAGADTQFVMADGAQTVAGAKTFSTAPTLLSITTKNVLYAGTSSQIAGVQLPGVQYALTGGADGTPTATQLLGDGITVNTTSNTLTFALPQHIAATDTPTFGGIILTVGGVSLAITHSLAAGRTYTFPDIGVAGTVAMLQGAQTFSGAKTFTAAVAVTAGQLVLGTGSTITVSAATPSASQIYTVPDVGADTQFVMAAGAQTVAGAKTFSTASTFSSLTASGAVYLSAAQQLASVALTNGQLLIGSTGSTPAVGTLTGTANRVTVTGGAGSITLSGPQDLHSGAAPTFASAALTATANQLTLGTTNTTTITSPAPAASRVYTIPDAGTSTQFVMAAGAQTVAGAKTFSATPTFSSLTASTAVYLDATQQLATVALTNGQLLIGSTGAAPAVGTLTGTANRITVTSGAGSITLSGPQDLHSGASPSFSSINLSSSTFTMNSVNATFTGVVSSTPMNYVFGPVNTGGSTATVAILEHANTFADVVSFVAGAVITTSSNQIIFGSEQTTTLNVATPAASLVYTLPDVGSSAAFVMTAGAQTIAGAKTFSATPAFSSLTASTTVYLNASKQLTSVALTNGQLLIGSTGAAPVAATLTGTANRITVTSGAGSITLSGPQDLHSGAGPTFASAALTATANQLALGTTNTVTITSPAPAASAVYTIPDVGTASTFAMLDGAQTFAGVKTFTQPLTMSSLTASAAIYSNTSQQLVGVALTNGQLLIGSTGSAPAVGTLTGTANRVTVTGGAGSITLSGPQDLHTGAAPTFASATFNSSFINFGTYRIAVENLSATRIYTVPELGVNNTFAMLGGTQTFDGAKTFSATLHVLSASNQLVIGPSGSAVTINVPGVAAASTYTLPDVGTVASFVMTAGAQTILDPKVFMSQLITAAPVNQLVLGSPNTITITAPSPAVSRVYTVPDTGAASSFVMTDLAQTLNGAKTFSSTLAVSATTNQLLLGTTNTITLTAPAPAASRVYTIPDAGGAASFVMTESAQTLNGIKTFTSSPVISTATASAAIYLNASRAITSAALTNGQLLIGSTGADPVAASIVGTANRVTVNAGAGSITLSGPQDIHTSAAPIFTSMSLTALTNQLVLGTTNTTTITSPSPAASRVYTVPDAGGAASFVMTAGAQTVAGVKTFSSAPVVSGLTASSALYLNAAQTLTAATLTNGQLLIGSTGANPAVGSITGTANRVTVTDGAGSITLSGPQDLGTTSIPTFGGTIDGTLLEYSVGTASQTTTTVTGVGTTFTAAMVGGLFMPKNGQAVVITAFTNVTTLTVGVSQTAASGTYVIIYNFASGLGSYLSRYGHLVLRTTSASATTTTGLTLQLVPNAGGASYAIDVATYNSPFTTPCNGRITFTDNNFGADYAYWSKTPGADTNPLVNIFNITGAGVVTTKNNTLDNAGAANVGALNCRTSITLPTTGGTATALTYYEEFTYSGTVSGIWGATVNAITLKFTRIGRMVTAVLEANILTATGAGPTTISLGSAIPARFRPAGTLRVAWTTQSNSTVTLSLCDIPATGVMVWYRGAGLNFQNGGTSGIIAGSATWSV